MRVKPNNLFLVAGFLAGGVIAAAPAAAQNFSQSQSQGQQPSQQEIEKFCANWGQLSDSEKRQYRDQYKRYCRDEPVFGQPVAPEPQTNIMQPADPQQQPSQQQPSQQPERPDEPQAPEAPEAPEPELEPAKPEPVIPEPEPRRVDLVGEVALAGPLASQPGERQRLRVTVKNRDAGGGPHLPAVDRLWARVFLSDQQVSGRGASAFSFSGARQGQPVRLPGMPGPGRSREVTPEVILPAGMPDGNYWWCVQVDTRQQVEETDESNNVACARKVVALGGEPDSELSDVFGSKVEELSEQEREGTQTASQSSHPGLLRQSELDRMAAMLRQTGGRDYIVLTGQAGGDLTEAHKRGLLLMRERGELIPLGVDYYKDGRGNMVIFGELPGSGGDAVPYALSLFSGGGLQLVADTDRDGLIDVGVSEGLKERFGFLARPGMEHILDCMNQMVQGGTGAAESLPECLSGGSSDDGDSGGDGGGVGGGPGSDLDSALEPDCGKEGLTSTGFANRPTVYPPYGHESMTRDGVFEQARDWAERHVEWHGTFAEEMRAAGRDELARAHAQTANRAREFAAAAERALDTNRGSSERAKAFKEVEDAYNDFMDAYEDVWDIRETERNRETSGGKEMPGPGPGGMPGSDNSDPRCEEPSTWNRLATEECANDLAHCINKLTDPLYAGTDGQCRTEPGPDDSATIQCDGDDSFGECFADGGSVEECREQHAGGDERGETPGENDEIFEDHQGSGGYGLMDVHAFGATLAAMCQQAGGIGPCGDPSPTMSETLERSGFNAPQEAR